MGVVTMKMKNCCVKAKETESQEEKVQEVDSRLQRQGDSCRKERICDFIANRSCNTT